MPAMLFPDVSVQVTQRRWRLLLDPNLALAPSGAAFARRLASVAEIWLSTEFFNILDSASIYQEEPDLLLWPGGDDAAARQLPAVLRDWTRLRDEAAYGTAPLHWIGDILRESCLPPGMNEHVVARWEEAARALDARLPSVVVGSGPLTAAMRDIVALSGILPAAPILVLRDADAGHNGPLLCRQVSDWGFSSHYLASTDPLVNIEREGLRQLLVRAGLADLVWAGLDLAVVHLHAEGVSRLAAQSDQPTDDEDMIRRSIDQGHNLVEPWQGARIFWYDLVQEHVHAR